MAKLDKMSLADLEALEAELGAVKAARKAADRDKVRAKLIAEAQKGGFTIEELFGGKRSGKRGTVAPKYRNPKDASETWTGRGRRPRWLAAALKKRGVKIEHFAI